MYTASGNLLRRLASRLLAKDTVFEAVQAGLRSTLEARKAMDRNVGRVLAGLNVPSNQEVERLTEEVRALDQEIGRLSARIERLADAAEVSTGIAGPEAKCYDPEPTRTTGAT